MRSSSRNRSLGNLDIISLIDFIDRNTATVAFKGFPQLALLDDVIADILDPLVTQLRIAQATPRLVFIQALLRLGGGFDMPLDQR